MPRCRSECRANLGPPVSARVNGNDSIPPHPPPHTHTNRPALIFTGPCLRQRLDTILLTPTLSNTYWIAHRVYSIYNNDWIPLHTMSTHLPRGQPCAQEPAIVCDDSIPLWSSPARVYDNDSKLSLLPPPPNPHTHTDRQALIFTGRPCIRQRLDTPPPPLPPHTPTDRPALVFTSPCLPQRLHTILLTPTRTNAYWLAHRAYSIYDNGSMQPPPPHTHTRTNTYWPAHRPFSIYDNDWIPLHTYPLIHIAASPVLKNGPLSVTTRYPATLPRTHT